MLNGYSLQLALANDHAMVLGYLVNMYRKSLQRPLHDQILSYQSVFELFVREIPSITFFGVSEEEMVNFRADLEDCFAKSKTMPGTRRR